MAETVGSVFRERAARLGERPALRLLRAGGAPRDATLSWREWEHAARCFAAALIATGHRPGDAVAIFAGNELLWPIADLGIVLAGGVSVGLYPTSAPAQVERVLRDCAAVAAVADTAARAAVLARAAAANGEIPRVVIGAEGADATGSVVAWEAWLRRGAEAIERGAAAELDARLARATADDIALLIYTSGSTGEPKGARIPHRYLLASARSIRQVLGMDERDTALSFLPFCHAAERVFGLYTRMVCGMEAALVPDAARLWDAARAYGPTTFGGLPRIYEKIYDALRAEHAALEDAAARARWDRTIALGTHIAALREAGEAVPAALPAEWRAVGAPVFARARAPLGGQVRLATSGGAALPLEVARYLDAVGLPVLGAYGLSEHLCAALNRPDDYVLDAAGPPMPGTDVRIAPDGEILLRRGPLTFAGYHGRPAETAAAFTDDGAWLRTGDFGGLDARGMLRVTGRKKELIALSGGKKVAPLPIETRLARHPWIERAVLHGEGERFIAALIVPRRGEIEAWARTMGIAAEWPHLAAHPEVRGRVQAALDEVNAELSRPERVRRFALLDRDFSLDADELTPTLKIRRDVVAARHRALLNALYNGALP